MTIHVTPQMLRDTAAAIQSNMEHALAIGKGYLSNHQNVLGPGSWEGGASTASYTTATEVANDLNKILMGGTRLTDGLTKAAALMEAHEADSVHAFNGLFGAAGQSA
ncbi:MAG: WXG100 family type VII secretion target [Mycobacterium sp.]